MKRRDLIRVMSAASLAGIVLPVPRVLRELIDPGDLPNPALNPVDWAVHREDMWAFVGRGFEYDGLSELFIYPFAGQEAEVPTIEVWFRSSTNQHLEFSLSYGGKGPDLIRAGDEFEIPVGMTHGGASVTPGWNMVHEVARPFAGRMSIQGTLS